MSTILPTDRLGETLFSRNRKAVLALLYGHPDEEFYLRQIVRATGGGVGAVQRELKQLVAAGIICRTVRGKQVYFQANAECPVFAELKGMLVKTAGMADFLKASLTPLADRIHVAFVFGSMARTEQRSGSDVDLVVVGDVKFGEVVAALAVAQAGLQREVNPVVYSPVDFSERVVAGNHFITDVLKKEKILLIGDEGELRRLAEKRMADRT